MRGFVMAKFLLRLADACGGLPACVREAVSVTLFAAPFAAFLCAAIVLAAVKGLRARSKAWFLCLSGACMLLFSAFSVFGGAEPLLLFVAAALAQAALDLALYGGLCLFRPRAEKPKKKKRPPLPALDEEEEFSAPPLAPAPRKVDCFTDGEGVPPRPRDDVRIDYALSVAERLRTLPLGAGDRLESDKMCELLRIYKDKGALGVSECRTLNDILAALLKMMAKYDA